MQRCRLAVAGWLVGLLVALFSTPGQACLCLLLGSAFKCPEPPTCCESGQYALDECGCCMKCAKAELQKCGGASDISGKCGRGLQCLKTCLPCLTVGSEGKPCIFPFIYQNTTYTKCTARDSDNGQPWCATSVDNTGYVVDYAWGDCANGCPGTSLECNDRYFSLEEGTCIDVSVPGAIPNWEGAPAVKLEKPTELLFDTDVCKTKGTRRQYANTCRCDRGETAQDYDTVGKPRGNCTGLDDNESDNLDKVWCFLENIRDPEDPKSGCYSDTTWSAKDGRYWSSLACTQDPDVNSSQDFPTQAPPTFRPFQRQENIPQVRSRPNPGPTRPPPTRRPTTRRPTTTTQNPEPTTEFVASFDYKDYKDEVERENEIYEDKEPKRSFVVYEDNYEENYKQSFDGPYNDDIYDYDDDKEADEYSDNYQTNFDDNNYNNDDDYETGRFEFFNDRQQQTTRRPSPPPTEAPVTQRARQRSRPTSLSFQFDYTEDQPQIEEEEEASSGERSGQPSFLPTRQPKQQRIRPATTNRARSKNARRRQTTTRYDYDYEDDLNANSRNAVDIEGPLAISKRRKTTTRGNLARKFRTRPPTTARPLEEDTTVENSQFLQGEFGLNNIPVSLSLFEEEIFQKLPTTQDPFQFLFAREDTQSFDDLDFERQRSKTTTERAVFRPTFRPTLRPSVTATFSPTLVRVDTETLRRGAITPSQNKRRDETTSRPIQPTQTTAEPVTEPNSEHDYDYYYYNDIDYNILLDKQPSTPTPTSTTTATPAPVRTSTVRSLVPTVIATTSKHSETDGVSENEVESDASARDTGSQSLREQLKINALKRPNLFKLLPKKRRVQVKKGADGNKIIQKLTTNGHSDGSGLLAVRERERAREREAGIKFPGLALVLNDRPDRRSGVRSADTLARISSETTTPETLDTMDTTLPVESSTTVFIPTPLALSLEDAVATTAAVPTSASSTTTTAQTVTSESSQQLPVTALKTSQQQQATAPIDSVDINQATTASLDTTNNTPEIQQQQTTAVSLPAATSSSTTVDNSPVVLPTTTATIPTAGVSSADNNASIFSSTPPAAVKATIDSTSPAKPTTTTATSTSTTQLTTTIASAVSSSSATVTELPDISPEEELKNVIQSGIVNLGLFGIWSTRSPPVESQPRPVFRPDPALKYN